jgi:hypothetical protein
MNILDRLNDIEQVEDRLNESGLRNITKLAKEYKKAEIYFHKDLDGITSAIGMKTYLRNYGIKTIAAHPIQYGGEEYAVPKPKNKVLAVLVDFAHGKPIMNIHTDHHEGQIGVEKGTSTSFVKTPSNAAYISQVLSPSDLFPPKDTKIISTVDSADFGSQDLTPDDIMRAVFKVDKRKGGKINHQMMGFATNKLVLAHKNKKGFLENLVMQAKPSLMSIYNTTIKLAEKAGYRPPEQLEIEQGKYIEQIKGKIQKQGNPKDVKRLKSGQSMMIGTTIAQYGGGAMGRGNLYDRYTPFKVNPTSDFYTIVWPMGLVQLSKNPFKGKNPYHLGDIVMKKVMPKFKSKMKGIRVTLDYIKWTFENDKSFDKDSMGFTFKDLLALFKGKLKGLDGSDKWQGMIEDITNKPYKYLSKKQKAILKKVSINLWDLVMSQSGGHKDITNVSGLNFYGKGFTDFMRDIQFEIVKQMKDKQLED